MKGNKMRSGNIKVTFSIPISINKPDDNGIIYTEEAIIKACENANNQPIIQFNNKGEEIVIGHSNNVKYSNGFIWVEGVIYHGGTNDVVDILKAGTVFDFKISSFGMCE